MEMHIKPVPTGLWEKCKHISLYFNAKPNEIPLYTDSSDKDPTGGRNHIKDFLNSDSSQLPMMTGVLFTAPPPIMAPDKLPAFDIVDTDLVKLTAERPFPPVNPSHSEWKPTKSVEGLQQ